MKEINKTNCEDFVKYILHEFVQDRNYIRGSIELLILLYEDNKTEDIEKIKEPLMKKLEQI